MYEFVEHIPRMPRGFTNDLGAQQIAKRLILLRKAIDISQQRLAEKLNIGRSQWGNYESGDPERVITLYVAIQLCQIASVTLDWIYRGNEMLLPPELKEELRVQERLLAQRKARPKGRGRPSKLS